MKARPYCCFVRLCQHRPPGDHTGGLCLQDHESAVQLGHQLLVQVCELLAGLDYCSKRPLLYMLRLLLLVAELFLVGAWCGVGINDCSYCSRHNRSHHHLPLSSAAISTSCCCFCCCFVTRP